MQQTHEHPTLVDYEAIGTSVMVPPMGDAARQLLALNDEDDGYDARVLAKIAQDDPSHLARLLSMANASARGLSRPARSPDEAIQVIGTRDAHATMLALALASTFVPLASAAPLRPWLLDHSVNLALAARRVASFMDLSAQRASSLQMAALFDPLGVHAALGMSRVLRDGLLDVVIGASREARPPWPGDLPVLDGYWRLSSIIARRWRAPREVNAILESRWSPERAEEDIGDGALLWLAQDLLARRMSGHLDLEGLASQPNPLGPETVERLVTRGERELAFTWAN